MHALVFTIYTIVTKYGVLILKVKWEIFPAINVANCEAPVVKVL